MSHIVYSNERICLVIATPNIDMIFLTGAYCTSPPPSPPASSRLGPASDYDSSNPTELGDTVTYPCQAGGYNR